MLAWNFPFQLYTIAIFIGLYSMRKYKGEMIVDMRD
jgi:hypothetical protein